MKERTGTIEVKIELLCSYFKEFEKQCLSKLIEFTDERKKFIMMILEELVKICPERPCILLNGPQGTGKSSTLCLLSHILSLYSDIRIVFVSNCGLILGPKPNILMEEINHIFPEIPLDSELKIIKNYLIKNKKDNKFTIFICDQVNSLCYQDFTIKISPFTDLPWSMIICSQSYNNQLDDGFKKFFKNFKTIEIKKWIDENQLKTIIKNEGNLLKLNLNSTDINKILNIAGLNPREALSILNSKKSNFKEKIENYIEVRKDEIFNSHRDLVKKISDDYEKTELRKNVFFMDTNVVHYYKGDPTINKTLMIPEKNKDGGYTFQGISNISTETLKEFYRRNSLINKSFISSIRSEIFNIMKSEMIQGSIEYLYKEFINYGFENAVGTMFSLNIHSVKDIRNNKEKIDYEVKL